MKHLVRLARCLIALIFLPLSPLLVAQSSPQDAQSGSSAGRTATPPIQVIVTGCLKRGGESGGYYLSDQNGTMWELTSNSVNLAEHVYHSVTITGKPVANAPQQSSEERSGTTQPSGKPRPALRVLTLKMLSPSCTR